jgi:CRP-like cAMP-binding protein
VSVIWLTSVIITIRPRFPSISTLAPAQGHLTTGRSQRGHAAESLRRAARISALQRRSALLPEPARARERATAPAPHLCKRLALSVIFSLVSPLHSYQQVRNIILLSISDSDYSSLRPHLEYVSLPNHLVLHEAGGKLEFAYFPNRGLISLVVVMKDGKTAEAGIVGNEGFTGTPTTVGLSRSPLEAVVQITGDGFRVKAGALQNTLESAPHLQLMLSRYAVVRGMQVAQTAACNRLHDIEQRLARWLLMTQDRVDSGALPITHDFLATMLGTDRSTVSLAAGALQRKELIEYTRGAVKIVNRKKLEDSACECYGVVRQYDGELGLK